MDCPACGGHLSRLDVLSPAEEYLTPTNMGTGVVRQWAVAVVACDRCEWVAPTEEATVTFRDDGGREFTLEKVAGVWHVKDAHGLVQMRGSRAVCESYLRRLGFTFTED